MKLLLDTIISVTGCNCVSVLLISSTLCIYMLIEFAKQNVLHTAETAAATLSRCLSANCNGSSPSKESSSDSAKCCRVIGAYSGNILNSLNCRRLFKYRANGLILPSFCLPAQRHSDKYRDTHVVAQADDVPQTHRHKYVKRYTHGNTGTPTRIC